MSQPLHRPFRPIKRPTPIKAERLKTLEEALLEDELKNVADKLRIEKDPEKIRALRQKADELSYNLQRWDLLDKQGSGLWDNVKDFFQARKDYPVSVKKFLSSVGNVQIKTVHVFRQPVNSVVQWFLNKISLGNFNKALKQLNYDQLFHLGLLINGDIVVQKNDSVAIGWKTSALNNAEYMPVKLPSNPLYLIQMLETTLKQSNPNRFFSYNADSWNCQRYILDILQANNLASPDLEKFILQDAKAIFAQMPAFVSKFSDALTDVARKGRELIGGKISARIKRA